MTCTGLPAYELLYIHCLLPFTGYDWLNDWYDYMYNFKLLGLALSALLTVSPVNFDYPNETEFPFTRTDQVTWRTSMSIEDLGYHENLDLATLSDGLEAQTETTTHDYLFNYKVHIYCSSACSVTQPTNGSVSPISQDIWLYEWSQPVVSTPKEVGTKFYSFTQGGTQTQIDTYDNASSFGTMNVPVPFYGGTWQLYIKFPAVYEGMALEGIHWSLEDFKQDYELVNKRRLIYQLVLDKDVDAEYQRRVLQLLNQNDIDAAYNLVNNYYNTYSVTDTEHNEDVVNNYNSKETDLNQKITNENNITLQFEDKFNNALPDIDTQHNNGVLPIDKFVKSANWVTDRFNDFTVNNAFGSLLASTLMIGFILALIGRVLK